MKLLRDHGLAEHHIRIEAGVNADRHLLDLYENLDLDALDICKPANIGEIRRKFLHFLCWMN
jgi:hypothetical protein